MDSSAATPELRRDALAAICELACLQRPLHWRGIFTRPESPRLCSLLVYIEADTCLRTEFACTVQQGSEEAGHEDDIVISKESRSNMLGILSVSILLGAVLSVTGTESNALLNLFIGLSNASVTISHLIAWYSPVGIFFLVATRTSQVRDTGRVFRSIFEYVLTALACLLLYGLVFLPALYAAVTRRSLRRFLRLTTSPMLKAVRSASRAVSMPETIDVLEEIEELEPRIVRFVIPVGANVSMSGTAVVVSVAAVFLAKFNGLELGPEDMIGIGTTTLFASLGAASIPNSSVLTLLMILRILELPNSDISLVFAADCIIDRFRIAANIFTDSVGSAVVQQFSRLEPLEDTVDESVPPLPGLGLTSDVLRCLPGAEIPQGSSPVVHRHRKASDTVLLEVQDHQQSIAFGQHSQQGMVLPKQHQRKQDLSDDRHSRGIMKSSSTLHDRRRHHRQKKKASRLVEVPEAARGDEDSQPSKKPKEQKYHKRRHHRPKRAKDANASSTAIKDCTTEQTASSMVPPSVLAQLGRRTSSSTAVKPET
ncbi:putative sodium-dependent excitatory amino acid transporter glt-4 [Ixodes scapularis]